jgi:hypothetical protein
MKVTLWIAFFSLFLTSCATQIDYTANSSGRLPRPADCNIEVYFPGTPLNKPYKVMGSLVIGDTGFTVDCSQTTVLKQAREQGCKAGADAIVINEVKEPDWISLCFRIRANMLVFTSGKKATSSPIQSTSPVKTYSKKADLSTTADTPTLPPVKSAPVSRHKWHKPVE